MHFLFVTNLTQSLNLIPCTAQDCRMIYLFEICCRLSKVYGYILYTVYSLYFHPCVHLNGSPKNVRMDCTATGRIGYSKNVRIHFASYSAFVQEGFLLKNNANTIVENRAVLRVLHLILNNANTIVENRAERVKKRRGSRVG